MNSLYICKNYPYLSWASKVLEQPIINAYQSTCIIDGASIDTSCSPVALAALQWPLSALQYKAELL
jgi:hypothetical protein